MILEHLSLVQSIANRVYRKVTDGVSPGDLISAGVVGLIAAVDAFDPRRNVKFKTYAEHRIRGAMLDSLRRLDWVPRNTRRKAKQIEVAIAVAAQRHRRLPSEEEIAGELGVSLKEYHQWRAELLNINIRRLEYAGEKDDRGKFSRFAASPEESLPSHVLERQELRKLLIATIAGMPRAQRMVLRAHYFEDLPFKEIAKILGVSLSRVFQLKAQGIVWLQNQLRNDWPAQGSGWTPARS